MLSKMAIAQLAHMVKTLEENPKAKLSLSTLKKFIGEQGVQRIKEAKENLADLKRTTSTTQSLSPGAQHYWKKYKALKRKADHVFALGNREAERAMFFASEALNDEFYKLVGEEEHAKFRIHNGPEDEENWDWRWEGLEVRPPLLLEALDQEFVLADDLMNFAQLEVLSSIIAPPPTPEDRAASAARMEKVKAMIAKERESR